MIKNQKMKGFTLMEILIVVVIVSILMTIAYPSYVGYMERTRRLETQANMLDLASALETYRSQNLSYQGANVATLAPSLATNDFFSVTLSPNPLPAGAQDYEVIAMPRSGKMMSGTGAMKLNSNGESCWDETNDADCTYGDHSWN